MRHRMRLMAVLATLTFMAAACGGGNDSTGQSTTSSGSTPGSASTAPDADPLADLVAEAQAEGSLTVYSTHVDSVNAAIADAFKAEYGIDIDVLRVRSGDMAQRVPAEAAAGTVTADVLISTDEAFLDKARADGLTIDLDAEVIPELAGFPSDFVRANRVGLAIIVPVLTYNKDLLPPDLVPESWEDLLHPDLRGEIILVDPRLAPGWTALLQLLDDQLGRDFTEALAAQDLKIYEAGGPGSEAITAGEAWIVFPNTTTSTAPLIEAGAPLVDIVMNPTSASIQQLSIVNDAPHPKTAALFANFMLTPAGQLAINGDSTPSPLGEVGGLPIPEGFVPVDLAESAAKAEAGGLYQALGL